MPKFRFPPPEDLWDLTPLESLALDAVFLMANVAPPTTSQVALLTGVEEKLNGLRGRIRDGWPVEEAFRYVKRGPFTVKLQKGRRPAWTVGEVRAGLAWMGVVEGRGRRIPSWPRTREVLALLCDRGFVQEERRGAKGGRRVYRFVRLPDSVEELRSIPSPGTPSASGRAAGPR